MKSAILITLCACLLAIPAAAGPEQNLVRAEILANISSIEPGKPFEVGVRLMLAKGWHVYWINPGSGIATTIQFDLPEGFTASDVRYPIPQRFDLAGGIVSFGYSDEVMLMATITPPKQLKPGSEVTLGAKAFWLVCQENCVKGDQSVKVALKVDAKPQAANAELFDKWRAQLPQPTQIVKQEAKIDAPGGHFKNAAVKLIADWKTPPEKVEWFPATPDQLMVVDDKVTSESGKSIVTFKVEALAGEKFSASEFASVLVYTLDGKRIGLSVPIKLNTKS